MNTTKAHKRSARLRAIAVAPLLVAAWGCTGTISSDTGDDSVSVDGNGPSGSSTHAIDPDSRPVSLEGAPLFTRFVRLTNDQWENSVRDILKLDGATGAQFGHAVAGVSDFDNNEKVVFVDNGVWKDFQIGAETVAGNLTDQAVQKIVATNDPATFIKTFGRRAFRRDLTDDEVTQYKSLFSAESSYSGSQSPFTTGAALVISAILQSPHFIYREELGDDGKPLAGYELAAKLSLFIRNTTPTDAMLDLAKTGAFDTVDGAASQAEKMLEEPAARTMMQALHAQLYKLDLVSTTISKDGVDGWNKDVIPEFAEASTRFFDRLFTQNLGVADLLTSKVAFAGPLMASLYGVTVQGTGVQQVELKDRPGWYTQAPFLTLWGVNNDPDSIHRGVRVNLDTLCADPGSPVANIPPVPPLEPNQSNRERYQALTGSCGNPCHTQYINPIGFAFENYDGLGRYRTTDHGKPVDASSKYPFAEGVKSFTGPTELMNIVANGSQAHECYSKKMLSYALQRDLVEKDRPLVESLGHTSLSTKASLKNLIVALVKTDEFRTRVGGAL